MFLFVGLFVCFGRHSARLLLVGSICFFDPLLCQEQNTKNLIKSDLWKTVTEGAHAHYNIHEVYLGSHTFGSYFWFYFQTIKIYNGKYSFIEHIRFPPELLLAGNWLLGG